MQKKTREERAIEDVKKRIEIIEFAVQTGDSLKDLDSPDIIIPDTQSIQRFHDDHMSFNSDLRHEMVSNNNNLYINIKKPAPRGDKTPS